MARNTLDCCRRRIQEELAQDDPVGIWIDTDDLNGGDKSAPQGELHYPKEQSFQLGVRFGEAALKQLGSNNSTTIKPHPTD